MELLKTQWEQGKFLCVGLDPKLERIPRVILQRKIADTIFAFNREIIDATLDLVCAYKPNVAFYEVYQEEGVRALANTISYINERVPDIPVLLDAKRTDVPETNKETVIWAFGELGVDGITVNPYFGKDALLPFLEQEDKLILPVVRSSNPGYNDFQKLQVRITNESGCPEDMFLFEYIASQIARKWNENGNCGVVAGSTHLEDLARVRKAVGDIPILTPGIGAQTGNLEETVQHAMNSQDSGMIISSSRSIIFASMEEDFATEARTQAGSMNTFINYYRTSRGV